MGTTIITKNGSGAPAASDLVAGELAVDLTNKRLYTEDSGANILELGSNPSTIVVAGTSTLTGNVTASSDVSVGGNLTVTGNATIEGNLTFGNAATDTITLTADVASNIVPSADDTYDLGATASRWRDIYIDGTAYLDAINFNGTAITATAAELNILDGVTSTAAELNLVDGSSAGTVVNSKAVVYGASGEVNATTLQIAGTSITSTAAELNILDGKAFLDEDDMSSDSATGIASQQSIKAYVDSQVSANNELSEVLSNGNTTGATNIVVTAGQSITTDSILETTAAAGVDIDGVLLKDTSVGTDDASGTDQAGTAVTVKGGAGTGTGAGGSLVFQTAPAAGSTGSDVNAQVTALTIDSAGDATFTGASYNMSWDKSADSLIFADNAKAVFGAGSDLQIYHDGTDSYITDTTGGNLFINEEGVGYLMMKGSDLYFRNPSNADMIHAQSGGYVKLYHNGAEKLATTSTGADITGTLTADGLTVDSSSGITVNGPTNQDGKLNLVAYAGVQDAEARIQAARGNTTGTDSRLQFLTNNGTSLLTRVDINDNGNISFYEDTGTTAKLYWDASAESLGIGTSSPSAPLDVVGNSASVRINESSGGDLRLSVTGSTTRINGYSNHPMLFSTNNTERMRIDSAGDVGIGTTPSYRLHVSDTAADIALFSSSHATTTNFYINNTNATANNTANLYFSPANAVAGAYISAIAIEDFSTSANRTADLAFYTRKDGTFGERVRIDSSGVVDIKGGGSASAPSLILAGDSDTGQFRPAANTIAWTTGGTERLRINDSGDLLIGRTTTPPTAGAKLAVLGTGDTAIQVTKSGVIAGRMSAVTTGIAFGVDGADGATERMRIDSSGNVGIGTTSPSSYFTGATNLVLSGTGDSGLTINSGTSDAGRIHFADGTSGDARYRGYLVYSHSSDSLQVATGGSERMRIDSSGNLLVGTTTTDTTAGSGFTVQADGQLFSSAVSQHVATMTRLTDDGDILTFRRSAVGGSGLATVGSIGAEGGDLTIGNADTGLQFVNTSQIIRPQNLTTNTAIDAQVDLGQSAYRFKDLYLSGGLYVGGAVAANYLDDYEEGTWTPVVTDGTNDATMLTSAGNGGKYTKVGNLVTFTAQVTVDTIGSVGADARIKGLPFTNGVTGSSRAGVAVGYGSSLAITAGRTISAYVELNQTNIYLFEWAATTGSSALSGSQITNGGSLFISGQYYAA